MNTSTYNAKNNLYFKTHTNGKQTMYSLTLIDKNFDAISNIKDTFNADVMKATMQGTADMRKFSKELRAKGLL